MPFTPIDPPARTLPDQIPVAYTVHFRREGAKGGRNPVLFFRIAQPLAKRAGIKVGDALSLRLGSGPDAGSLQLLPVAQARVPRRVRAGSTPAAALQYSCPYTGEFPRLMPPYQKPTALRVLDASQSQGLILELPTPGNTPP